MQPPFQAAGPSTPSAAEAQATAGSSAWSGYDAGVSRHLDYPPLTLQAVLRETAQRCPERTAMVFADVRISYRTLDELADACAAGLVAGGVQQGDRVAILLPNVPQFPIAYYGILRAGAVPVLCNILYAPPELAQQLADSAATVVIALDLFMPVLNSALACGLSLPVRRVLHASPLVYLGLAAALAYRVRLGRGVRRSVDRRMRVASFDEALRRYRGRAYTEVAADPSAVAALLYTGGTTGVAKGAMLTHRNLLANAMQIWSWDPRAQRDREVFLCTVPFFHSSALSGCLNVAIYGGATLVLQPRFVPVQVARAIERHRPTYWAGHPPMVLAIAEIAERRRLDCSSLRICIAGGDHLTGELQERFERATGARLRQAYGMTETGPITLCSPLYQPAVAGSVGVPFPDTDVKLDHDAVADAEHPEFGELLVRGPQVMAGYWRRPDETARVLDDGWMRTGDVARVDEHGFYYIVDRLKNLIMVDTLNVYPTAVEAVLCGHPAVLEALVVGVPDDRHGQRVRAYVVPGRAPDGALTDEILAHCRARLAAFKVPAEIEYRAELPKSVLGKAQRSRLAHER